MLLNGVSPVWLPGTELGVSPACATHCCVPCYGDLPAGNCAMSSMVVLYGFCLWHVCQGLHQNHPTAVHIAVVTCLFCTKTSQARLTFPVSQAKLSLQQGLKATCSKLFLALMFSSLVLIFLSFSFWWGKAMHLFSSPSSLKSSQKAYGGILQRIIKSEQIWGDKEQLLLLLFLSFAVY